MASLLGATSTWFVSLSSGTGFGTSAWADYTDNVEWSKQTAGDFDGDGRTDIATGQASNGRLWVSRSLGSRFATSAWALDPALMNDIAPIAADFSGDDRADIGIQVGNAWTVFRSTGAGFVVEHWGSFLD